MHCMICLGSGISCQKSKIIENLAKSYSFCAWLVYKPQQSAHKLFSFLPQIYLDICFFLLFVKLYFHEFTCRGSLTDRSRVVLCHTV